MVVSFAQQVSLLALLFVNHIASFLVTAAVVIWFETIFPQYGEAPSLWIVVLPLRTAILYTLHSFVDRWAVRRASRPARSCDVCQTKLDASPIFSLAVAVTFQTLFYEPRWVCAVLGVSDQGPMCSLPHAIILEIPLGFTMLIFADTVRSGHTHGDITDWAATHCSARSLSLYLTGVGIALSSAMTRYERIWSLSIDLFKRPPFLGSLTLLACLVQIESQLITTVLSHLESRVWPSPDKNLAFPGTTVSGVKPRRPHKMPTSRPVMQPR